MKTAHFLKKDLTASQDLSTGALSYTSSGGREFKVEEVLIHFSVAVTETITVTRDSKNGVNYDTVLDRGYMVGEQDYVYRPQGECNFQDGDEIKVQCTNANTTGICYLTIKRSEL
jgi:hypothetical protein